MSNPTQLVSRVSSGHDTRDTEILLLKRMLRTQRGLNKASCQRISDLNASNKSLLDSDISLLTSKLLAKDDWLSKLLDLSTAQQKHMTASFSFRDTASRLIATLVKDAQLRRMGDCRVEGKIGVLEEEMRVQREMLARAVGERLGEGMEVCEGKEEVGEYMEICASEEPLCEPMEICASDEDAYDPMEL